MFDPERMRMKRLSMRLSQQRLAALVGTDQAHISRIETGQRTELSVQTLEQIADALQVTTDYLLGRDKREVHA